MNIHVEDFGEMQNYMILVEALKKSDNGLSEESFIKYIPHELVYFKTFHIVQILFSVLCNLKIFRTLELILKNYKIIEFFKIKFILFF